MQVLHADTICISRCTHACVFPLPTEAHCMYVYVRLNVYMYVFFPFQQKPPLLINVFMFNLYLYTYVSSVCIYVYMHVYICMYIYKSCVYVCGMHFFACMYIWQLHTCIHVVHSRRGVLEWLFIFVFMGVFSGYTYTHKYAHINTYTHHTQRSAWESHAFHVILHGSIWQLHTQIRTHAYIPYTQRYAYISHAFHVILHGSIWQLQTHTQICTHTYIHTVHAEERLCKPCFSSSFSWVCSVVTHQRDFSVCSREIGINHVWGMYIHEIYDHACVYQLGFPYVQGK
jgi:hypothetical protein